MKGLLCMAMSALLGAGAAPDPKLASDLARVGSGRILFGHQSVGRNILDGVERLAAAPAPAVRVVEATSAGPLPAGTLSHAFLGANGDPAGKLASFDALLAAAGDAPPDVAFMKFCYADFGPGTDPAAVFAAYRAKLAELRRRHPRTTFVHVTAPLTIVQSGPKALVKRLLGQPPWGAVENVRRDDFNRLMRAEYEGREPLFDLAALESTSPSGARVTFEWQVRQVPALAPEFTDDGGHLNPAGQDRISRALVGFLASLR
jgi:lysophospholipase L1-like esterase